MSRNDRLVPVPGDVDGLHRCPECDSTLFEELDGDPAQLEVRRHEGAFQVRQPLGQAARGRRP